MQKQVKERSEKIKIETPYGTIESDSGNHYLDIATILLVISFCAFLKIKGLQWLKNLVGGKKND